MARQKLTQAKTPSLEWFPSLRRRHAPEAASFPAIRLPRQFGARYNSRLIIIGAPEKAPGAPRDALPMTTAAIRRLAIPSADELVERARAMAPEIRALAEETERTRNLSPHIVDKIREAELLRTCRPRMFGGVEYDGEVVLKISRTISADRASTGWDVNGAVWEGSSFAHWLGGAQRGLLEGG